MSYDLKNLTNNHNRNVHDENFPRFPWNFTEEEKAQMRVKSAIALEDLDKVENALHDMEVW